MHKVVLIRHGQSTWNAENRFTGWTDVDLNDQGIIEARQGGELLRSEGFVFDIAYTSLLRRAIRTLWIVLDELDQMWIPVVRSWRLNERHYGDLQGLNKAETAAKYGEEQVHLWRRSYDVQPPPMSRDDARHARHDPRYAQLAPEDVPDTECLKDVVERFLPVWNEEIAPAVRSGKRVLIVAHGNSLRALVKHLDGVSDADIVGLNIPTGVPLVYELGEDLRPVGHRYLGDPEEIRRATEAVAKQGKAKG